MCEECVADIVMSQRSRVERHTVVEGCQLVGGERDGCVAISYVC